jgi:hypothetical protein
MTGVCVEILDIKFSCCRWKITERLSMRFANGCPKLKIGVVADTGYDHVAFDGLHIPMLLPQHL